MGHPAGVTQNVVVGQPISLQASVNPPVAVIGESWSSPQWSSSTIVANYQVASDDTTGTVTLYVPSTTTLPGTFYWISGSNGQSWNVTFSYCMANSQCSSAYVPFNVSAPTITQMSNPTGTVGIFAGPVLGFGPVGIQFNPTYSTPSGYNANLQWVQLITNDVEKLTPANGSPILTCVPRTKPTASTGTGLDSHYPFASSSSTRDSPTMGLLAASYIEETRSFSATMYAMWDPALPSGCTPGVNCTSIPVPIGYITWGFSGDALYNGSTGQWQMRAPGSVTAPSYTNSSAYPTWSSFVPYDGVLSCHT